MAYICPRCGGTDMRSVPMVYASGSQGGGAVGALNGGAAGAAVTTGGSLLAHAVAPPPKQDPYLETAFEVLGWFISICFGILLLPLALGIPLIVHGRRARRAATLYNEQEWPARYEEWSKRWLCMSCGAVWLPDDPLPPAPPLPATPEPAAPQVDPTSLERLLLNPGAFRPVGTIDAEVPDRPGLYAIRIRDRSVLPEPFAGLSAQRGQDLLYLGVAGESLRKRMLGQELRARGHGTFFRSIGAVLGYRPAAGSLLGKVNTDNYRFAPADERAIITWIDEHLLVNWVTTSDDQAAQESMLITQHQPLLNLKHNPAKLPELEALRYECARIASSAA